MMRCGRWTLLGLVQGCLVLSGFVGSSLGVDVHLDGQSAVIENDLVRVNYDLAHGTYSATDKKTGQGVITGAQSRWDDAVSSAEGIRHAARSEPLSDALGMGQSLLIRSTVPDGRILLLRISLYDGSGFVAFCAGLENGTDKPVQLKEMCPLWDATVFQGQDLQTRYATLDGMGGGGPTLVDRTGRARNSRNNMLATFGAAASRRSLVLGGLSYAEFEKYGEVARNGDSLRARLYASDPVGKRIDPGSRYLPEDRYYLDFLTASPFDALEAYARNLRLAQGIVLNVCRFPIVDTWFAQVPHFGGGEDKAGYRARNDSVGAVEEMECIARSGFLKYVPVAVLLEPDLYDANNQQGWWDDEHWQRGPSNRARGAGAWLSSHGQFVAPYETARKWASAIKALGGIPMIYLQTGFRSQDYAEAFPQHMLFQQANAPYLNDKGEQQYRDKEKKYPRKMGYDYTQPDFQRHMREVWENLHLAGVQGVKFDYPDLPFTGWPTHGGMADSYATTAMHYRTIFRLAQRGLGPDCYIHERALDRGSDVTLGLVTSQRTEGDTDRMNAGMVSRVGLRWYKNRVVVNYDMDGKNPFHVAPDNLDGQRAVWTMAYVASGTLMLSPSFARMTPAQIHDLSRIYPFHSQPQSARPLDAFASPLPRVYDFKINPAWHQLTFYNTEENQETRIGVDFAGDAGEGAMGLDPAKEYYVYDFWNDRLLGKYAGSKRFEQTLRPGEARMMSVREVQENPQVLATDRHIMQGLVDLPGTNWDPGARKLSGVSNVIGGESYRVIIANNGHKASAATIDDAIDQSIAKSRFGAAAQQVKAKIRSLPGNQELTELTLDRPDNGPVVWNVTFEKP